MAATTAWPSWLPKSPISFEEVPQLVTILSPVDAGMPKARRLFTKNVRQYQVTFEMDWDELAEFDAWYYAPVGQGLNGGAEVYRGVVYRDRLQRECDKRIVPDSIKYNWAGSEIFHVSFTELVWADF